ncbi:hypothetical protein ACO0LF_15110 [Undibacterium sp. Di27W]|uniref:hypothetical protein n=1 Tax=Undibacterium sp. Di27W TaxID=3413036 RepID=UPI003BF31260
MSHRKTLFPLLLICMVGQAHALTEDERMCRAGLYTADLGKIEVASLNIPSGQRLHFLKDDDACPEKGDSCKEKAYLLNGDEVLVSKRMGKWACAWFPGAKSATVGWIDGEKLISKPKKTGTLDDWYGKWNFYQSGFLNFKKSGAGLALEGQAYWRGLNANVHTGDINAHITPHNNLAQMKDGEGEYACVASFRLLGEYLLVADNKNCGGANVSFDGVYRKTRAK